MDGCLANFVLVGLKSNDRVVYVCLFVCFVFFVRPRREANIKMGLGGAGKINFSRL